MRQAKIRYYDDKEEHGIIYDWDMIRKEYRKLVKVKDIYDPCTAPVDNTAYTTLMSIRSTGKTTAWILIGMIMRRHYGTQIIYMRQREDEIMPKFSQEALKVINSYKGGYYISELTDGRYNATYTHARRTYFCRRDEDGRITEKEEEPFMIAVAVEQSELLKSGFNVPQGDLVIYDEFITKVQNPDDFENFMQLMSTIIRKRKSVRCILLANNTNVHHQFFREFEISKDVRDLKEGEYKYLKTGMGTSIYVELIGLKPSRIRQEVNAFYFGFNNPKLSSIQGGVAWVFDMVPHIHHADSDIYVNRMLHIFVNEEMLRVDLVISEDRGLICNVVPSKKPKGDAVILTLGDITSTRELYGYGRGPLCVKVWELYRQNKWYYADNETGSLVTDYVRQCRLKRI